MNTFTKALITTFIFLSLGFLLLEIDLFGYGITFFVFLPFTLGYILGNSFVKKFSLGGIITSIILFLGLLYANSLEGMVCILMALPLVIIALSIGFIIRSAFAKNKKPNVLKTSLLPIGILLISGLSEQKLANSQTEIISISTSISLPYSNMQVYETIKSVDTLDTEKPFLMQLDLPIPHKCILENEKVGGIRTCYFEGGKIIEKVTALKKGKLLQMDVIDYQLKGRKWLGFKEAIYTFEAINENECKMTRITTYTSKLHPRFYWAPLEKMGIEQEHEYVFNNLVKDLNSRFK